MQPFKKLSALVFLPALFTGISIMATAQQKITAKEMQIKNLVDSERYVFYAQTANAASGHQRFLTSEYTVGISKDSVISYLPYFGRAYSAPIASADAGIKFTAVKFDYTKKERKKGGWEINIKPSDAGDVQQMMFTIYTNGTAYLSVNSNNRQSISFNGYITAVKPK